MKNQKLQLSTHRYNIGSPVTLELYTTYYLMFWKKIQNQPRFNSSLTKLQQKQMEPIIENISQQVDTDQNKDSITLQNTKYQLISPGNQNKNQNLSLPIRQILPKEDLKVGLITHETNIKQSFSTAQSSQNTNLNNNLQSQRILCQIYNQKETITNQDLSPKQLIVQKVVSQSNIKPEAEVPTIDVDYQGSQSLYLYPCQKLTFDNQDHLTELETTQNNQLSIGPSCSLQGFDQKDDRQEITRRCEASEKKNEALQKRNQELSAQVSLMRQQINRLLVLVKDNIKEAI